MKSKPVYKVYSGKRGCMCGCNGKWSYASEFRELGSKERGYSVDNEDINDRSVKIMTTRVLNNPAVQYDPDANCAYVETPTRMSAIYFVKEN